MEYLVSQREMKTYDENTIKQYKIPAIVLMERAALKTAEEIMRKWPDRSQKVLVVSGTGNNGGDGIAAGRILWLAGYEVDCVMLGDREKATGQTTLQIQVWEAYGRMLYGTIPAGEYDIIVDAIFGVGLTRDVEGIYAESMKLIGQMNAHICAVDIPSGIHADTGKVMGCAVSADLTVTYGFRKTGQYLYPGASYCGEIVCVQMGIDEKSFFGNPPRIYTYNDLSDVRLPLRRPDGNKGTFGKTVVIAGSEKMAGAALLAAESVFRSGVGMVKLVTSENNKESILQNLPECMYTVYKEDILDGGNIEEREEYWDAFAKEVKGSLEWADCILIGPGIGMGEAAKRLFRICLYESRLPIVIDADGLRLLAEEIKSEHAEIDGSVEKDGKADKMTLKKAFEDRICILTPHLGEFAALYGCQIPEAKEHILDYPKHLADKLNSIVVCKDARTIAAVPGKDALYFNLSGNAGMASAGSGDVLAGLIAGLLTQYIVNDRVQGLTGNDTHNAIGEDAAVNGVYLHGLAGDMAKEKRGEHGMLAGDIVRKITDLLRELSSGLKGTE